MQTHDWLASYIGFTQCKVCKAIRIGKNSYFDAKGVHGKEEGACPANYGESVTMPAKGEPIRPTLNHSYVSNKD